MIIRINEEELRSLIQKEYIEPGVEQGGMNFKPDFKKNVKSVDYLAIKMVEEDGTSRIQGFVGAEIVQLQKKLVANINVLVRTLDYSDRGYGSVLLYHMIRYIKEVYNVDTIQVARCNQLGLKVFLNNGFENPKGEYDSTKNIKMVLKNFD